MPIAGTFAPFAFFGLYLFVFRTVSDAASIITLANVTASTTVAAVRLVRKGTAVATMSLFQGGTTNVFLRSGKNQMSRVTTTPVIAHNMINQGDMLAIPFRQGTDKPSEHYAVSILFMTMYEDASVTISQRSVPVPASGCGINIDLSKNTNYVFDGKMLNYQVCFISHSANPPMIRGFG
jgi:hypothetical protein